LSNISEEIKQKYRDFTKDQLIDAEKRHEDEYVHGELMWQYKKEQIIQSWATLLHWMHDSGYYKRPLRTISSYIKNRLRIRLASQGSIDYVDDCLTGVYEIYKDPKYNSWEFRNQYLNNEAGKSLPSVFETFEQMAAQIKSKQDIKNLSKAERQEVAKIFFDQDKEIRKRLRDQKDDYIDVFEELGETLPNQANKVTAEFPPTEFWGQSELYFAEKNLSERLGILEEYIGRMKKYVDYEADLIYKFKPSKEVSEKCARMLSQYEKTVFNPITTMIQVIDYALRGVLDMKEMVADAKNCQPLVDWFKTSIDKEVSAGAHGAGVLHSIETGVYVMELGKDGKSVVEVPIEREITREQCTDKIPKMLTKARNIAMMHPCEKMIQTWSKSAECEIKIQDPDEFYRREMAKRAGGR
jgi:hypothetical protein